MSDFNNIDFNNSWFFDKNSGNITIPKNENKHVDLYKVQENSCSMYGEKIRINENNLNNLKTQLADLEIKLYWNKVDWKLWTGDSEIDNEYLKNYQEINYIDESQKFEDLENKIKFLKDLLEKFSKQKWLEWIDLSDKKYDKVKNKIIWYWNKENFYDLVSNMKNDNSWRYEIFEELIKQWNAWDAYLVLFLWPYKDDWEAWLNWIKKINSWLNDKESEKKDYLLFTIPKDKLINIWKENDIENIKKEMKELSDSDFSMYNTIYYNSSDDFKSQYLSNFKWLSQEQNNRMGWFKSYISEHIVRYFHNEKKDIFNNKEDFTNLLNDLLKWWSLINNIKTKVFWIQWYMDGDTVYNVENFIDLAYLLWKTLKVDTKGLYEKFKAEKEESINNLKEENLNIFDSKTIKDIKFILKEWYKEWEVCWSSDKKDNTMSKIQIILKLDKVKEYLNNQKIQEDKKSKAIMNLLFDSINQAKIETIDTINSVLYKKENEKLKDSLWKYIIKHWDTKKDIFDTDRVIRELDDEFYNQENDKDLKNKKTKSQLLESKLKAIWLDKLSKEDYSKIKEQFSTLLNLEKDKEKLEQIKSNPERFQNFSDFVNWKIDINEYEKISKEIDIKDKSNQETLKSDLQKNNPNTIISDLANWWAQIKVWNTEFDLDSKELSIIWNDSEKLSKFVDFKSNLDEMWLWFVWKDRNILFQNIKNKKWENSIDMLDNNVIWEQEFKNLLDYLADEIKLPKKENLEEFKQDFLKIKNDRNFNDKDYSWIDENKIFLEIFRENWLLVEWTNSIKKEF